MSDLDPWEPTYPYDRGRPSSARTPIISSPAIPQLSSRSLTGRGLNILALPVETTEHITRDLALTDFCSLRLASKDLSRKTFHIFERSYLTVARTDLSSKSLQKLHEVSNHSFFRRSIQTLHIRPNLNGNGNYYEYEQDFAWHRSSSGNLRSPLPAFSIIEDILVKRLINCKSIRIKGYDERLEWYSPGELTSSDIVGLMFAFIAETSIPIKSFFIDHGRHAGRVDARRLQIQLHRQPGFAAGWAHLEELLLPILITAEDSEWVRHLILQAPRLRKLWLRFESDTIQCSPLMDLLVSDHCLQGLQHLKLAYAEVTGQQILGLMSSCQDSLQDLCLVQVKLRSGSSWVSVVEEIRSHFPKLERFSLYYLKEDVNDKECLIEFPTLADNPKVPRSERKDMPSSDCHLLRPLGLPVRLTHKNWWRVPRVMGVSYRGCEMDAFLRIIARDMRPAVKSQTRPS